MKSHFIQLTTPAGSIHLRADAIIAVGQVVWMPGQHGKFQSQVWLTGMEEPFNIIEDVDTVMKRIFP